jgi:hypothetical protein
MGLLERRATLNALGGGLLAEDGVDPFCAQRTELTLEVLVARGDPRVADFPDLLSILIC